MYARTEGVSRSLNPHINIWEIARPIVEDYIAGAIGPKAVINDLIKTVKVLSRFGPRLPELAEAALINQAKPQKDLDRARPLRAMGYVALGAAITLAAVLIEAIL